MHMMIFGADGQRKYLTAPEEKLFIDSAIAVGGDTMTLCLLILYTGCRISEALSLKDINIDPAAKMITIESLKKRRKGVFRSIPVPDALIGMLHDVHKIRRHIGQGKEPITLWPFSRMTAYRRIRKVMEAAGLNGLHAMPKGLRHSFGVSAIQSQVPLNMVQRWLGHADMRTTAIYTSAIGPEERSIANRMWRNNAAKLTDWPKPAAA